MNIMKAPDVDFREAVSRVVVMIIAIILGILLSYATAEAGVSEHKPLNKTVQKKRNYSCMVLMDKHRNSSNIIVKKSRRPKWR
jgi:hypothetical protein